MASAKQDFARFVGWLHSPEKQISSDVRQLANLALANFNTLEQTSRQRSQRSAYLAGLIRSSLSQTVDTPPLVESAEIDGNWPWKRLRHLTLGPFRGFLTPEPFDLQKRVILFYGPNGSGKTSLCEGLEYALLGEVEEASSKRININTYLTNIHARHFNAPVLKATTHKNCEVDVIANAEAYRFCFIEKNRIDAFSRIAARPTVQRSELIATLFGMEQFNEFVSHFNDSIDGQLFLQPNKQTILTAYRNALANDQATVIGETQALQTLANEEAEVARKYSTGVTYAELKQLIGNTESSGRLQELEGILNAIPPPIIGLTRQGLLDSFDNAHKLHAQLAEIAGTLDVRSSQISFKELYTSLLALQAIDGDHCPACDTPLTGSIHVRRNPFDKARTGLDQLKELSELQEQLKTIQTKTITALSDLRRQLTVLTLFGATPQEQKISLDRYLAHFPAEPVADWWANVYPPEPAMNPDAITLEQILKVSDLVAEHDADALRAQQWRQPHIEERDRLNEYRFLAQAQDLKRQQLLVYIATARSNIEAFDIENANLIAEVEQEIRDIHRDSPIKTTYDKFLTELRSYRNQLPGSLMTGLNETAMRFYNEFNRSDLDADKLAILYLPATGEDKIEITFRGNPLARVDALHILSEGHIRCLGLAILLAKAQNIQSPLIVFDDAINAIDHDHRSGIRETLFESDHFAQTQIIVTCHSNEFIKDIQQHLPAQRRNDCQVYLLRHHNGNYQPRVTGNVPSKNYVIKARASKDVLDDREALASSRQALEMFSEKVWNWLASHEMGILNLQLAGVKAEIGLRNLCEALLKRLNEATTFNHANKQPLLTAFGRILGIPSANLVWTYLNKGTHEEADRDDFDADLVESVVKTLEDLDGLDLRPNR